MLVFKFGGASVRSAEAVRNVARIVGGHRGQKMVVVISAMGKMTNKLEELHRARFNGEDTKSILAEIEQFHLAIAGELGKKTAEAIGEPLNDLRETVNRPAGTDYDLEYDRVVCFGELLSTRLVEAHLREQGILSEWLDVRNVIRTNNKHRSASVDWVRTEMNAGILQAHLEQENVEVIVTQGFIGSSSLGNTTTLGREGSDYTGGILANLLDADKLVIWKDVAGMLNADPKWFNHAVKLDRISYREAVELSYFGASVIHPKTIKPLQNKDIPLYVRSFEDPETEGTVIHSDMAYDSLVPSYIFRPDQSLVSISPKDFSFIVESHLGEIFEVCSSIDLRINLMQNSALNFSIVIDHDERKLDQLTDLLRTSYTVRYNEGLKLLTIRHYDQATVNQLTAGHEVLLEQKSRQTLRIAMRENTEG